MRFCRSGDGTTIAWAELGDGPPVLKAPHWMSHLELDWQSPVYAGNLGYGPNPKLVERVKTADLVIAVGARLGEATTDGYELITPDHPDQILVHGGLRIGPPGWSGDVDVRLYGGLDPQLDGLAKAPDHQRDSYQHTHRDGQR